MNLESKYKALNSFQKDLVWIFRAKVCDDCYEIDSLKNEENRYYSPEFDML